MSWTRAFRDRASVLAKRNPELAFGPPLDVATLAALASVCGVDLPADYRRFVCDIGDGGHCWDGRLLPFESVLERSRGRLDRPFVPAPPTDADTYPKGDAPGMLRISDSGCGYGSGLVLSGAERGTIWTYVECWPGWHPAIDAIEEQVRDREGSYRDTSDLESFYVAALSPWNAGVRQGFRQWMTSWLVYHLER